MTRATEIVKPVVETGYLAVLKPRRHVPNADWTLISTDMIGNETRETTFTFGEVVALFVDDLEFTKVSGTPSVGQFSWDRDTGLLTAVFGVGTFSGGFTVATYRIDIATKPLHAPKDPTDSSSEVVYWEGTIRSAPVLGESVEDEIFGFLPLQSSALVISNYDHFYERHVYDSSFNRAEIDLYHYAGSSSDTANFKKLLTALTSNPVWTGSQVEFQITDFHDVLSEFRTNGTYNKTDFPNVDPDFDGAPVREVIGIANAFIPVNVDYQTDNPDGTVNRKWACVAGTQANFPERTATVGSGSSATKTVVDDATGFLFDDSVRFDRVVGTDETLSLGTVDDFTEDALPHAALSGGAMASGDTVKRGFVGNVTVLMEGVEYRLDYIDDFTIAYDIDGVTGIHGFEFTTSMETNQGMPRKFNPSTDTVRCRVYGPEDLPQISASDFGSVDTLGAALPAGELLSGTGTVTNAVVLVYKLLRELGVAEADIDTAAFQALESDAPAIGLAHPASGLDEEQTYKQLLLRILQSDLLRLYIDQNGKWTITRQGPFGAADSEIDDTGITRNAISYEFDYRDISSIVSLRYLIGEGTYRFIKATGFPRVVFMDVRIATTAEQDSARYLHKIRKTRTYDSVLLREAEATVLADRLAFIFSERKGRISISTKNEFFDSEIDETVNVKRTALPGSAFNADTVREQKGKILERRRSLESVNIILDDQKGIEDNSGSW